MSSNDMSTNVGTIMPVQAKPLSRLSNYVIAFTAFSSKKTSVLQSMSNVGCMQ